jgi:hypothetical protein
LEEEYVRVFGEKKGALL